jgi:hypothetical protein
MLYREREGPSAQRIQPLNAAASFFLEEAGPLSVEAAVHGGEVRRR